MKVVGVGSAWRGDDAAGLAVAAALRDERPGGVEAVEHAAGDPAALIDLWDGAADVVVVDAVSSGAAAGTVHHFDACAGPLPAELFGSSTHALGLADAVELARALDRLPARLRIVGIEGRAFGHGAGLTPAVEHAVARVVSELRSPRP